MLNPTATALCVFKLYGRNSKIIVRWPPRIITTRRNKTSTSGHPGQPRLNHKP